MGSRGQNQSRALRESLPKSKRVSITGDWRSVTDIVDLLRWSRKGSVTIVAACLTEEFLTSL